MSQQSQSDSAVVGTSDREPHRPLRKLDVPAVNADEDPPEECEAGRCQKGTIGSTRSQNCFWEIYVKIVGCQALHRRDRDDQGPRYLLSLVYLEGVTQKGRTKFLCNISVGNLVLHSKKKFVELREFSLITLAEWVEPTQRIVNFWLLPNIIFWGEGGWRFCAVPFF